MQENMKQLFTLIALLLSLNCLLAKDKNTGRIEGKVLDPQGQVVSYATVLAINVQDSTIAKTAYSTENGKFILGPLKPGTYRVKIQFTGLAQYEGQVLSLQAGQTLELDPITMVEPEADLEAVQISARKPLVEVKPDMTVFNVKGTANNIGDNAFDLLRKAPGVIVDNNDNILLMGKSGVRIYIDGKPSPLSVADLAAMLKGMQSNQIESIEIITNPSARYEAEGNAGIINIKLVKDQSLGTNGSVALGYNYGQNSRYDGSVTFNHRNKVVNVFGNYSGGIGRTYSFTDFYREQSGTAFDQRTDRNNDYLNNNFKAGVDFFLGDEHTVGVMVNGFFSENNMRSESLTPISVLATGEAINTLDAVSEFDMQNQNLNFNLNYGFQNKAGTSWSVDADYGQFRLSNQSLQPNYYLDPQTGDTLSEVTFATLTPTNIDIYTFKTDHERKLAGGKLSAGVRLAYVETDNDFGFYDVLGGEQILDENRSNRFIYQENINAAYATYQRQIEKWNLELGLRAEHTRTNGELISVQNTGLDTVQREYLNLFPTAGITFSPNRTNSFRLNYSRRIDRPRYQDLNPFVNQMDQLTFQRGNPFLRPQFTHSIQGTYTYQYRYSASLSYSITDDFFTQITDTLGDQASFITQENLASREVISANISAPISIKKWWSTYTNLNLSRTRNTGDFNLPGEQGKAIDIARTTFNIYQQHTFQLPGNVALELSGFYNSPSIWGANYLTRQFWGINAGAQVRFLDQKAMLKVSVNDIFYSMQWAGVQEFGGLYFEANGGWESRQIRANFTYNFGNSKVKASRKRKTGLQDEASRANGGGQGPGN
jgi:iron complex outermembrane receptor protein